MSPEMSAEVSPEISSLSMAPVADSSPTTQRNRAVTVSGGAWLSNLRLAVLASIADYVATQRTALDVAGFDAAGDLLEEFVSRGKCLRSTFMYLGWLSGAAPSSAALSAAASLELLHAFALLQDDVMDQSSERRGLPAAHVKLARWYRESGLSGSAERFGESAATLLGDMCLIWAEQMLRESGIDAHRLQRIWPRYDAMRIELAVGQFGDLASDVRDLPSLDAVLDVARRKSGNYTVRRPLEIGAAMAGCDDRTLAQLGRYGAAVGEAFQLRDDLLGVFGSPAITGKPSGGDLLERKATSVVVTAHHLADEPARLRLVELVNSDDLDETQLDCFKTLIVTTGAAQRIEDMIGHRVELARNALDELAIDDAVQRALDDLAVACAKRSA
ncbi:polyprenyl synthetase family protein [Mycobacterium spongiae]|uniref:Polyprenyl synthetase family protein n=2 Tax=Mycobacterium spongiae TaxID=886343 RepID=A0A975K4D3_9MYCO|nr:polyprenyl synthetase family protein [Mycobacterium spongiae]